MSNVTVKATHPTEVTTPPAIFTELSVPLGPTSGIQRCVIEPKPRSQDVAAQATCRWP